jgi:hypothetical protein
MIRSAIEDRMADAGREAGDDLNSSCAILYGPRAGGCSECFAPLITGGKIAGVVVIADPERLRERDLAVLND